MSQSKGNTKVRRLGAVRTSLRTPAKEAIPKLTTLNSGGDVSTGVTGSAMTVPPQKEKNTAREVAEKPKSAVKSDSGNSGKSDSASSTKSQELQDKKELQEVKAREKELLKQLSSLQKLIEDLRDQIKDKENNIVNLQNQLEIQKENCESLVEKEKEQHKCTQLSKDKLQKELETHRQEVIVVREECKQSIDKLSVQYEDKISALTEEKDKEIKIRDEKLSRLKMQMADALKGNSWERQQQLEELTKELGRLQEEADTLRHKLKAVRPKGQTHCANCQDMSGKVEKLQLTVKDKDVTIKDLKTLIVKFEKQLTQQDEILKMWSESKGYKVNNYPGK